MKIFCLTISAVNSHWRRLLLSAIAVSSLFLSACEARKEVTVLQGKTMGTYWQVSIGQSLNGVAAKEIQKKIEADLLAVNQMMSTYIDDSELVQFNRHLSTEVVPISKPLQKVIAKALEISKQSQGYYDVTVGPLVDLWGFGPKKIDRAPTPEEIDRARARVGYQFLHLDEAGLSKDKPDIALDLSSIAKGYGVDVVAERLEQEGYANYLVDIGGEVRANGGKFDDSWTIGIELPEQYREEFASIIYTNKKPLSLATSGNYRNYTDYGGIHAVHTINPKTGRTEQSTLLSVTVLAENCMSADAYATALMALGESKADAFAKQYNLPVLFIYAGKLPDSFKIVTTPAYKAIVDGNNG